MKSLFSNKILGIVTVILMVQAVLFYTASHGEATPLAAPLVGFPMNVGSWHTVQVGIMPQDELDVLRADDTMIREYSSSEGSGSIFIAYFRTQRQGQSPHSPKNCLPGSGWQPEPDSGRIDVPVGDSTIRVNRYIVSKGEQKDVVFYWYQSQGRVIADEFAAKFFLVEDSIRKHRSDTSLVRIITTVSGNDINRAGKVGLDMVKTFYPVVKNYLPQ